MKCLNHPSNGLNHPLMDRHTWRGPRFCGTGKGLFSRSAWEVVSPPQRALVSSSATRTVMMIQILDRLKKSLWYS